MKVQGKAIGAGDVLWTSGGRRFRVSDWSSAPGPRQVFGYIVFDDDTESGYCGKHPADLFWEPQS